MAAADNGDTATMFAAYDWYTSTAPVDASDLGEGDDLPDDYAAISEFFL